MVDICEGCIGETLVHDYECRFTRLSIEYKRILDEFAKYKEDTQALIKEKDAEIKRLRGEMVTATTAGIRYYQNEGFYLPHVPVDIGVSGGKEK